MADQDGSIALSWTPRPAELADAQLARNREFGSSSARAGVAVLLALLAVPMLASQATIPLAVTCYGLAFLLVWSRVTASVMRRRWAALVAGNPALGDTVEATFDASGVRTDGARMSIARRWSAFTSWSDTPSAVVFSASDNLNAGVLVVPHRAASGPEELAAIRALAERQLGPARGSGPGRTGRRWWPWVARTLVGALLVVPVAIMTSDVHDDTGEWRLWPAEAPLVLTYDGVDFHRVGGRTGRPEGVAGVAYTAGGGLILRSYADPGPPTEVWVLDHDGVVHRYVTTAGSDEV